MLRALMIVLLVGGLLTLIALAGRHFFSHSAKVAVTSAPSIEQIREAGELVVLKLPIRDIVTAKVSGWTGGNSLVLIVHGEVGIGVDMTKAEYLEIDHNNRHAVLAVPEPTVMYSRLDHEHTRIHSLNRSGFWQVAIGNAAEDKLANKAYEKAQLVLRNAASDPVLIRQAREQAQQVIDNLFGDIGWQIEIATVNSN